MIEQMTRKYRCWIVGQYNETNEVIEAVSSWEARKKTANKYRLDTTDAVARRIDGVEGRT